MKKNEDDPIVGAIVNDSLVDLRFPFHSLSLDLSNPRAHMDQLFDVELKFVRFSEEAGQRLFWHSAAHVLGASLEAHFGDSVNLCDGPSITDAEGGFFYELNVPSASAKSIDGIHAISESTLPSLEVLAKKIVQGKHAFQRLEVSREFCAELFRANPFKLSMLSKIPADERITLYRCGGFVDLCRGPHVPDTGAFKAFFLYRSGGSQDAAHNAFLERVYGVAFPSTSGLQAWKTRVEEAKRRDHRLIGQVQELFFFHKYSPGSAFLLPHGTRIYNALMNLIRAQYLMRGYKEVMTPLIYKTDVWRQSGHLDNYAENMFSVVPGMDHQSHVHAHDHSHAHAHSHVNAPGAGEATETHEYEHFGLKPMNCPGHCLIFAQKRMSYRDLPMRLADFSALHRNEATGALGGLTRLRRFTQDDAHIFCKPDQIEAEVLDCLEFIHTVYTIFGFSFHAKLSTRPLDKFIGSTETWDHAEDCLRKAWKQYISTRLLNSTQQTLEVDVGGGAFYGPKLDIFVQDAIGRHHQCATVQLDFQLPQRFELRYDGPDGSSHTPVMIHRAILGSFERMMGILIEHTAGRWPFWLSPRHILVCTVSSAHSTYAKHVAAQLTAPSTSLYLSTTQPLYVDIDDSARTIPKKVREGQVMQYNLIVVVGEQEMNANFVTIRFRDSSTFEAFNSSLAYVNAAHYPQVASSEAEKRAAEANQQDTPLQSSESTPKPEKNAVVESPDTPSESKRVPTLTLPVEVLKLTCLHMINSFA
jgi:threonyl-tRNA synthetase